MLPDRPGVSRHRGPIRVLFQSIRDRRSPARQQLRPSVCQNVTKFLVLHRICNQALFSSPQRCLKLLVRANIRRFLCCITAMCSSAAHAVAHQCADQIIRKEASLLRGRCPRAPGIIAFEVRMLEGRLRPPRPFRLPSRRSGRIPALPYRSGSTRGTSPNCFLGRLTYCR